MNNNVIIGLVLSLLIVAFGAPIAFNAFATAEVNNRSDSFVAAEAVGTPEVFQLTKFPVVAASETVTLNATPISAAQYSLVDLTGALTLATVSDDMDVVGAAYEYERDLGDLWIILPLIAAAGLVVFLAKKSGVGG